MKKLEGRATKIIGGRSNNSPTIYLWEVTMTTTKKRFFWSVPIRHTEYIGLVQSEERAEALIASIKRLL